MRPNRSDAHLSEEAAAKVEAATREHFDGLAPKRHTKPDRSEYSSVYTDAAVSVSSNSDVIPECLQFQLLEKDTQKLVTNETKVADEFTETEYYGDLNCIDKQHHTTGTGFIKVDNTKGKSFSLTADSSATESHHHAPCRGNPATNDWIPATADMLDFISAKPNRSES